MDFSLLDFHLLNMMAGKPRVTMHDIMRTLSEHIKNKTHLRNRLESLSDNQLIIVQGEVVFSIAHLGKVLMGVVKPDEKTRALMQKKGLPEHLTVDWIEKRTAERRERVRRHSQDARGSQKETAAGVTARHPSSPAAKLQGGALKDLRDSLRKKRNVGSSGRGVTTPSTAASKSTAPSAPQTTPSKAASKSTPPSAPQITPSPATSKSTTPSAPQITPSPATSKSTTPSAPQITPSPATSKSTTPSAPQITPSPAEPVEAEKSKPSDGTSGSVLPVRQDQKRSTPVMIKPVNNAAHYCLTEREAQCLQVTEALGNAPASRLNEQMQQQFNVPAMSVAKVAESLFARGFITKNGTGDFVLSQDTCDKLSMGDRPAATVNLPAVFGLDREEWLIVEMALGHKSNMLKVRAIPDHLRQCGVAQTKEWVGEKLQSLILRGVLERRSNNAYYLSPPMMLAIGARRYSADRHDADIARLEDPEAFWIVLEAQGVPEPKSALKAIVANQAKGGTPTEKTPPLSKGNKERVTPSGESGTEEDRSSPPSTTPREPEGKGGNVSEEKTMNTEKNETREPSYAFSDELSELVDKIEAEPATIERLEEKLAFIDFLRDKMFAGKGKTCALLDSIENDLRTAGQAQ